MKHFLLVFDHEQGRLIEQKQFRASAAAVQAYRAVERDYQDQENIEVVLIGSDSIETIKATHANYFVDSPEYSSGYFDGVRALARRRHPAAPKRGTSTALSAPSATPAPLA